MALEKLEVQEQPSVIVWGENVPMDQISTFYDHSFAAVQAAIEKEQLTVSGPPYAMITKMGDVDGAPHLDLEVGFPIQEELNKAIEIEGNETVYSSELPQATVVKTTVVGSFDLLPQAWESFMKEIEAAGHTYKGPVWEVYLTEPGKAAEEEYVTELYVAIK